jgi:hypothetical protein
VGGFEERISDGVNGFLCEPDGSSVLRRLRDLARDRGKLAEVRARLSGTTHRTPEEMVADYEEILKAPAFSSKAYFLPPPGPDRAAAGPVTCQLFWLTNGPGFDEAMSSCVRAVPTPQRLRLRLPIGPQREPVTKLRLDLSDRPGLVLLEAVGIYDSDEKVVWQSAGPELFKEEGFSGMIPVAGSEADKGQLVFLTDRESIMLLSPGPDTLRRIQNGGFVEVKCSWPAPASHPSAVEQLLHGEGAGKLSPGERETMLERLVAELSGGLPINLRTQHDLGRLAAAHQRIASLEKSWSWRVTAPLRWLGRYALRARSRIARLWLTR